MAAMFFLSACVCASCDTWERSGPYRINEGPHTPTNSDDISQSSTNSWLSSPAVWNFHSSGLEPSQKPRLSSRLKPWRHPKLKFSCHWVVSTRNFSLQYLYVERQRFDQERPSRPRRNMLRSVSGAGARVNSQHLEVIPELLQELRVPTTTLHFVHFQLHRGRQLSWSAELPSFLVDSLPFSRLG